jgi:hypothetical protein
MVARVTGGCWAAAPPFWGLAALGPAGGWLDADQGGEGTKKGCAGATVADRGDDGGCSMAELGGGFTW